MNPDASSSTDSPHRGQNLASSGISEPQTEHFNVNSRRETGTRLKNVEGYQGVEEDVEAINMAALLASCP